jgi:hypothetical protein
VFVRVEKNPEKTGGGEEDERKPMRWSGVDEKKPDGMPGRWKRELSLFFLSSIVICPCVATGKPNIEQGDFILLRVTSTMAYNFRIPIIYTAFFIPLTNPVNQI